MKNHITIGSVEIPTNDFAIAASAWLGIKKSGKSYGAKGVAEQLIEAGIPIIVFDAIGMWRFLKTPGDKNGKGFEVVVAGGEDPDIPLTSDNISEIIRSAMRSNVSLVIDLYDPKLSKSDWRKIVQRGFNTLLYENKKHGHRYVILEEAAEYVPQRVFDGETFAAVEKVVRMGGNVGLGVGLINPRSQELNKAVLDLCDNLVLMRQRGNSAIDAVQKWMEKVDEDVADKIATSLPNLSAGECWVWAENSDKPVETKTHTIRSFHPDRTKQGDSIKSRAPIDTAAFVSKLLADLPKVVEEKKANDPTELRRALAEEKRRTSDLEKKLEIVNKRAPIKESKPVQLLSGSDLKRLTALTGAFDKLYAAAENSHIKFEGLAKAANDLKPDVAFFKNLLKPIATNRENPRSTAPWSEAEKNFRVNSVIPKDLKFEKITSGKWNVVGDLKINSAQQRILDALRWLETIGIDQPSTTQVGAIALIDSSGGYFSNMVGPLSNGGLIERSNGVIKLTDSGREVAQPTKSMDTLDDYHEMLRNRVRRMKSAGGKTVEILDAVINNGGDSIAVESIGERVHVDPSGGYFSNMIGPLSTIGLITRNRGMVTPTEILFPKGLS